MAGAARTKPESGRQRDVLDNLEELFLQEGFRDLTVSDLAARLKCSKRTLYELAASKQELFLLVVERWLSRLRHLGWAGALQHDDPEARIVAYLDPGITVTAKASQRFMEDVKSYRPATAILEAHQRERSDVLQDIIEDGIRRGRFRNIRSDLVADIFQVAAGRLNEPSFLRSTGLGFSEAFAQFYKLLLHGLFHAAGEAPGPGKKGKPADAATGEARRPRRR